VAKKRGARKVRILLTERALRDIAEIRDYSKEQFGKRVADQYISGLEAAIARIREEPNLLRKEAGFHPWLAFYRSQKHLLVCDRQEDAVFVLTLIHASMDIPSRLDNLQPTLKIETELLHRKLLQLRKSDGS